MYFTKWDSPWNLDPTSNKLACFQESQINLNFTEQPSLLELVIKLKKLSLAFLGVIHFEWR